MVFGEWAFIFPMPSPDKAGKQNWCHWCDCHGCFIWFWGSEFTLQLSLPLYLFYRGHSSCTILFSLTLLFKEGLFQMRLTWALMKREICGKLWKKCLGGVHINFLKGERSLRTLEDLRRQKYFVLKNIFLN